MLASHMPREVVLQYLAITSGKPTGYLATVPLMILQIFGTVEPFTDVLAQRTARQLTFVRPQAKMRPNMARQPVRFHRRARTEHASLLAVLEREENRLALLELETLQARREVQRSTILRLLLVVAVPICGEDPLNQRVQRTTLRQSPTHLVDVGHRPLVLELSLCNRGDL